MIFLLDYYSLKLVIEFFSFLELNILCNCEEEVESCIDYLVVFCSSKELEGFCKYLFENVKGKDIDFKWYFGYRILFWTEDFW